MSLALVFPGQGSQSVGMLAGFDSGLQQVKETFAVASGVLDFDLWELIQQGPEADLNDTRNTQPAMLAAGVALWRLWQERGGPAPAFMAGHSLGEYTALVCAGALEFADAVELVRDRGRYMQEAVVPGEGAMAAILGLEDSRVIRLCEQAGAGEVVAAVNFNSPGQVVVAGTAGAVRRAVDLAREEGARRAVLLPVSVPSHCSLMRQAARKLEERLAGVTIRTPGIPVVNNVDVRVESQPEAIRDALVRQLYNPVRWVDTIRLLAADGVERVVECGPGKVLAGLNRRIERSMTVCPVFDEESLQNAIEG
ncbi:MAG TPA: [acyl-carrier-protein] S-malonyltransferase [Gammaproteobacteria bacterium]|nr:[acyl-carrier-protein] S-malonyltransferase [Gammaproteobacteria bacterium]